MILATWALGALAGQVFYQELPLSEVIGMGDAAAIVTIGPDGLRPVEIPIPGTPEKTCGTYTYGVTRVSVKEVVRAPSLGPALAAGAVINVFPGNTPDLVEISTMACVEGMSVSPIFAVHRGEQPDPGDELLVLLRWVPPYGWVEAVAGSWLPAGKAKAVREATPTRFEVERGPAAEILCVDDADCGDKVCRAMRCAAP